MSSNAARLAHEVAAIARREAVQLAVAESLTGGAVCSALAAAPEAAQWFRGGIVAYAESVKFGLLGCTEGPVVSDVCAREMATGVAELLGADLAVAITGVGGPGSNEGEPPGTVWFATAAHGRTRTRLHRLSGTPDDIIGGATDLALELVLDALADQRTAA